MRFRPAPLSVFGSLAMTAVVVTSVIVEPRPGLEGDGPWVALSVVALAGGIVASLPRLERSGRQRTLGLLAVAAASCALTALQPGAIAFGAVYYVVIVAALRMAPVPALALSGLTLAGVGAVFAARAEAAAVVGFSASVIPWFLTMRLVRRLDAGRDQAEQLVDELRDSRAAHAEAAALAERGRVARDMHDVLAHSLAGLALQVEGARLLARERGADADVVAAIERAHHLAADGLAEAREAIAALRGDALPGPERLEHLAESFAGDARVTVTGAPRELESEARLAVYRTAQEALTNVLRHSRAEHVEIELAYEPDGTRLVVRDRGGDGEPVAVGPPTGGGGYGLTGMRERAELLGGRLTAAPTADGFRVELWLPA